jgi:glutamate racemase
MGPKVVLVSSGDETAFAVRDALSESGMAATNGVGSHRFLSSGDIAWFAQLGRRLLGPELDHAEQWSVNSHS